MENAGKRPLDDDSRETDGKDRKRLKINQTLLSKFGDIPIPKMKDSNNWKMLPKIVMELLSFFKPIIDKNQSKEALNDVKKEEPNILKNQICEKKSSQRSELLSSIKPKDLVNIKPTKDALNFEKSKFITDETKNDEVQKNTITRIEINPVESININDQKVKQEINETNKVANMYENSLSANVFSSIPSSSLSTENYVPKKITQGNSKTENNFKLSKSDQIFNLLKKFNINGMAEVPTSKPPPCVCQHCSYVDNLPIEQSLVNYRITPDIDSQWNFPYHHQYYSFNSDIYSSSPVVADCSVCASKGIYTTNDCCCVKSNSYNLETNTESSKRNWIAELTSLIRKNEDKYKNPTVKYKSNSNSYVKSTINKVKKTAKQIKTQITSCKVCKKFKYSTCKCFHRYKNKHDDLGGKYHRRYRYQHRY